MAEVYYLLAAAPPCCANVDLDVNRLPDVAGAADGDGLLVTVRRSETKKARRRTCGS